MHMVICIALPCILPSAWQFNIVAKIEPEHDENALSPFLDIIHKQQQQEAAVFFLFSFFSFFFLIFFFHCHFLLFVTISPLIIRHVFLFCQRQRIENNKISQWHLNATNSIYSHMKEYLIHRAILRLTCSTRMAIITNYFDSCAQAIIINIFKM